MELVQAFFVSKMSGGQPDAPRGENGEPDLQLRDDKGEAVEMTGWSSVGQLPVNGVDTRVDLFTSSREVIDWMKTKTARWGFIEEIVPPDEGVGAAGGVIVVGPMPTLKQRTDGIKALLTAAGCKTVNVMNWADETKLKHNVLDIHRITDEEWKMAGGTVE